MLGLRILIVQKGKEKNYFSRFFLQNLSGRKQVTEQRDRKWQICQTTQHENPLQVFPFQNNCN